MRYTFFLQRKSRASSCRPRRTLKVVGRLWSRDLLGLGYPFRIGRLLADAVDIPRSLNQRRRQARWHFTQIPLAQSHPNHAVGSLGIRTSWVVYW